MIQALFLFFFKLGFISVGGGYPMLAFIMHEGQAAVGLTAQEFADMAALELLASGPVAINSATYVGFIKAGFPGALVATVAVCLPSFILTTILYAFLSRFKVNKYVQGFLAAVKIGCGGVLLATSLSLAHTILLMDSSLTYILANPTTIQWAGIALCFICIVAIGKFKANPILMIFIAAAFGMVFMR